MSLHDGTAVPMLGPAWTLYFEMHFYVFFALALYFTRGLAFLCLLLTGLVVAGFFIQPTHAWSAVVTDPLLLEFMGGIGVAVLTRRLKVSTAVAWSCVAVAAVWLSVAIWFAPPKADGHIRVLLWGVPSTLLLAGAVWLNPACNGRLGRLLVLVGDASYSIYLFQVFALPAIAVFLRAAHLDRFLGIDTRTVLMWLLGCGAGVAFWAVVERPLTRRVKSWVTGGDRRNLSPVPVVSRS